MLNNNYNKQLIMKTLATLILIIGIFGCIHARLSQQFLLTVRPKLLTCAQTWKISQADLKALIADDLSNQSTNMQCMKLCFFQALGVMDGKGNLYVAQSIIKFSNGAPVAKVKELLNICKNLNGTDACNTANLIYDCFATNRFL